MLQHSIFANHCTYKKHSGTITLNCAVLPTNMSGGVQQTSNLCIWQPSLAMPFSTDSKKHALKTKLHSSKTYMILMIWIHHREWEDNVTWNLCKNSMFWLIHFSFLAVGHGCLKISHPLSGEWQGKFEKKLQIWLFFIVLLKWTRCIQLSLYLQFYNNAVK